MSTPAQELALLAESATGRCHSCANLRSAELPNRTIYFCRSFHREMTEAERDLVRDCPKWLPFRPVGASRRDRAANNPLIGHLVDAEDELFASLKFYLDPMQYDLKTLLLMSQPSLVDPGELAWVDGLEERFSITSPPPLSEILSELRRAHYDALCAMLDGILAKLEKNPE